MANDTEQLESLHKASLAVRSEIEAGIEAEGETSDLTLTLAHASIKTLEAFLGYLLGTYTPPSGTLIDKVIRTTKVAVERESKCRDCGRALEPADEGDPEGPWVDEDGDRECDVTFRDHWLFDPNEPVRK
jgi:hypothetical protein